MADQLIHDIRLRENSVQPVDFVGLCRLLRQNLRDMPEAREPVARCMTGHEHGENVGQIGCVDRQYQLYSIDALRRPMSLAPKRRRYDLSHCWEAGGSDMIPRIVILLLLALAPAVARADPQWLTLPPTPGLPQPVQSGSAPVNGIRIWYATFGADQGEPVILLHGGLANSDYWGNQVRALMNRYRVIVMDSRGHGRSTRNEQPYGYDLMASDVIGLMDFLKIPKAAIVGWSDGAIIGLDLAMHHPDRVAKLFAFAANSDPSGVADIAGSPVFNAFIARAETEYEKLSPTPTEYKAFLAQITRMWETQPNWTKDDLKRIAIPTWIVDGDHDEAIKRENTEFMAANIPDAGLLLQPEVSHFSFLQNPGQFTSDVLHFLEHVKSR